MIELYEVILTRDQIFDLIFAVESRISGLKVCLSFLPSLECDSVLKSTVSDLNSAVSEKLIDLQKNLSDANDLLLYLKKFI